ncbi:MAG: 8-amino-7-oxononanoate synthase [Parvibaculum sp.]
MGTLDDMARAKLAELEAQNLRRRLIDTDRLKDAYVERDGRTLISFCCNDYLNLAHDPRVIEAAKSVVDRHGTGSGSSRLVTGNHTLFGELERRLAKLKGSDDCVIFGSGYLANLGIIPTLMRPHDLILADELSHACLLAGTELSGAKNHRFRHNDMAHLRALLEAHRGEAQNCLIVTDGVFSMDGDVAPVAEMAAMAKEFDAWFMTDDAHGIGVLGEGRGSSFLSGTKADVPLQMGTLSKAIGSYGGYLCASQPVIDLIRTRARTLIYSTGLPPASVAAAIAALDIIEAEPEFAALPLQKARRFTRALNLPEAESPIVPLVVGDPEIALSASAYLSEHGFLVAAIRPPTVPQGTARLRFTFTAAHRDEDIDRLATLVGKHVLTKVAAE